MQNKSLRDEILLIKAQNDVLLAQNKKQANDLVNVDRSTATSVAVEQTAVTTTKKVFDVDEMVDWKVYRNEKVGIEFKYPNNWPNPVYSGVETPSDGDYPDLDSAWRINIGPLFDSCEGEVCYGMYFDGYENKDYAKFVNDLKLKETVKIKKEIVGNGLKSVVYVDEGICIYKAAFIFGTSSSIKLTSRCNRVPEKIFEQILSTVKIIKVKQDISFDNCGQLSKYKNEPWYLDFTKNITKNEFGINSIVEGCLSLDKNIFISLAHGSYCQAGSIYKYDIIKNVLTKARFEDYQRGCVAWPVEFGKRNSNIVSLQGRGGDAGAISVMYYDYDFIANKVELKKECYSLVNGAKQECIVYPKK